MARGTAKRAASGPGAAQTPASLRSQDSVAAAQEDGALGNAAAAAPQRAPGELEERSDAPSRVWGAQPGLLFQGEKQSCHPLVSIAGQESSPGTPCSAPLPWGFGAVFPLLLRTSSPHRACPGHWATTAAWLCIASKMGCCCMSVPTQRSSTMSLAAGSTTCRSAGLFYP